MKRIILLFALLAVVVYAIAQSPVPLRSGKGRRVTAATNFKNDSIYVGDRTQAGILVLRIYNPSTTDSLYVQWCKVWSDTATYSYVPPSAVLNEYFTSAYAIRFLTYRGASGSITGVLINF